MATFTIIAQPNASNVSAYLNSTKVKCISNVAVYYATGNNTPVAYTTGNCQLMPANTLRDINCGPGSQVLDANTAVVVSGLGPRVAFISQSGVAQITVTEIGSVDFTKVFN
jgi:hypothetical protein